VSFVDFSDPVLKIQGANPSWRSSGPIGQWNVSINFSCRQKQLM